MRIKKHIPNIITLFRIAGAVTMMFFKPQAPVFAVLYLFCGITDILDGFIARRLNAVSDTGARLDSVADCILATALLVKIVPIFNWEAWMILLIVIIASIRMITLIIGITKFHEIPYLHTLSNKLTGIVLFLTPLIYVIAGLDAAMAAACVIALYSASEELYITARSTELDRDIRGVWLIMKKRKRK